jgi:hypothetical protein
MLANGGVAAWFDLDQHKLSGTLCIATGKSDMSQRVDSVEKGGSNSM